MHAQTRAGSFLKEHVFAERRILKSGNVLDKNVTRGEDHVQKRPNTTGLAKGIEVQER